MAVKTAVAGSHFEAGTETETPIAGWAYDDASMTVLQIAVFGSGVSASLTNTTTGETFTVPAPDGSMALPVTGLTCAAGGGPGNFTFQSGTL